MVQATPYDPSEWDLQPDGMPRAAALVGANVTAVLPGHVVLRLEYVETEEQQKRFRAGQGGASFLQVAMAPDHARSLAQTLLDAGDHAQELADAPRN